MATHQNERIAIQSFAQPKPLRSCWKKSDGRLAIERAIANSRYGITRAEIVESTGVPATVVATVITALVKSGAAHGNGEKPARYLAGPKVQEVRDVVPPRSINVFALPKYTPPAWQVRAGAGEVRNRA